jgi:hypothetical protein
VRFGEICRVGSALISNRKVGFGFAENGWIHSADRKVKHVYANAAKGKKIKAKRLSTLCWK